MKEFWMLFKYEFKMKTPFFGKKSKVDILGWAFILFIVAILVYAAVVFLSKIIQNYLSVEINKVYQPIERAKEIISVLYLLVLTAMTLIVLERTRKVFADDKNKQIFLRLPLSKRNVFLSKFAVLFIHTCIIGLVFILTINCILHNVFPLGAQFWLSTVAVCIFMPIICLFLVSLLIVPYILVIEFLTNRYLVLFIMFTVMLAVAFVLYSKLLSIAQTLLVTGSIRFLFNEKTVQTLKAIYNYAYPNNAIVAILFEKNAIMSWLLLLIFSAVAVFVVSFVSSRLYKITLYRQPKNSIKVRKKTKIKKNSPIYSLIRKEFICIYRQPNHVFSYFSVAMTMPIMVYCSFTLFETLIFNTIGIKINFALALSIVLMFGVLTNTFCSTNITRDGYGILKMKTLPISVSKIFLSKVLFCAIISSLAVIISCLLLTFATGLQLYEGLLCLIIGLSFTFAQILVATKIDLNNSKISMRGMEADAHSSRTLSKVVLLGGALALIASVSSVYFALFASGIKIFNNPTLLKVCIYLIPALIGIVYLACGIIYFRKNISRSFEKLANN